MNTQAAAGFEELPPGLAQRVADTLGRFEKACQTVPPPSLESYLEDLPELARQVLLPHLILLEAANRRRLHETPQPADYLLRFPSLETAWLEQALAGPTVINSPPPSASSGRSEAALPAIPGYDIERVLGRGGMGVVYQARQQSLQRRVALKMLPAERGADPEALERFRREALTASALNHPHICTIYDLGDYRGQPFLAMEFIEGRTLRTLAGETPSLSRVLYWLGQVARALTAVHAAGIVHRDLKPENLMIRADDYVKVLDFGLARLLPGGGLSALLQGGPNSGSGAVMGTAGYMSPEQTRGDAAGSASDVFSLGIILYELVTGRHPFVAASTLGTLFAIASAPPLPPARLNPAVAPPLEALILRMLAKEARLRPAASEVAAALSELAAGRPGPLAGPPARAERLTVGRQRERQELQSAFDAAAAGQGLLLCLAGEPGIGKSTLVEDFLAELESNQACHIARGRCSERLAGAEAYLPVLEALDSLLRGQAGALAAPLLKALAPAWYVQVTPASDSALRLAAEAPASSQERLKRELLAFLEEMARLRPVVLFLDDLHWADISTIDMLAYLGQHCSSLPLLGVLTYRPADLLLSQHPFLQIKLELQGRGVCRELALDFLSRPDIEEYLAFAFPEHRLPADFPVLLHERTEGNPLFLADLLRYLRQRGVIAQQQGHWVLTPALEEVRRELPESVSSLIHRQLNRLSEGERRLLLAGSVQGYEFDAAVAAQVLKQDAADVEEQLEVLERVHGLVRLRRDHEFPDGTLTRRYQFVHVLYQNVLYSALQPARKAAWSAAVAKALEGYHGDKHSAVAAELALLWEAARDWAQSAAAFQLASQNAMQVVAYQGGLQLARRGLEILRKLPDTPARARQELGLQSTLGTSLIATQGYASPEVSKTFSRARELCQQLGDRRSLCPVLWGLWTFHLIRGEMPTARKLAEQLLAEAQDLQDSALLLMGRQSLGSTLVHQGEFLAALEHFDEGEALYDSQRDVAYTTLLGIHPLVAARCFKAWSLWSLGRLGEAGATFSQALTLARQMPQSISLAHAYFSEGFFRQFFGDGPGTLESSETLLALCREQGFPFYLGLATVWRGWALAEQGQREEGVEQMRQGIAYCRAIGAEILGAQMLGMTAEILGKGGLVADGLAAVAEALAVAERTGELYYAAELHRLQGEFLLRKPGGLPLRAEAETCFRHALAVARRQHAKAFELRAAISLFRLGRDGGPTEEARQLLSEVYCWFTEGVDTPDLQEARTLLAERPPP